MIESAAEMIKENGEKKTLIVFDTDGDGISSAVILVKTFKKLFKKYPKVMTANHGLLFITKSMFEKIKRENFDFIITVDIAIDESPKYILDLAKRSKVLIIDHHQIHKNLNGTKNILHVNPVLWETDIPSYKYCTSKIVYDICSKTANIDDMNWIAGIGIVNDISQNTWKSFMEKIYKDHNISLSKLNLINNFITAGYSYSGINGVKVGYKACLESSSPHEILKAKTGSTRALEKFYKAVEKEIVYSLKNWKKNADIIEHKNLIILKLNTKFSIGSAVSTKLSFMKPNHTVIIAVKSGESISINLRRQDRKVNCGEIATKATRGLKNAGGGGHVPAAGAHIMSKDWELFRKRIINLV